MPAAYPQNDRPAGPKFSTSAERRQRDWELAHAVEAARALQARLELLGDHPDDVAAIHRLRDRLADELSRETW